MEEKDEWVFFAEIDWLDPKNNRFNVDTRDFHSGYLFDSEPHPDLETLKGLDRFLYSVEELKTILTNLFNESGGKCKWRCLELESKDDRVRNWRLKYIRIYRLEDSQFLICNDELIAISKDLFECKVNQKFLHAH